MFSSLGSGPQSYIDLHRFLKSSEPVHQGLLLSHRNRHISLPLFMIKTAGNSWFTDTVPKSVKEAIERSAKMNNKNGIPSEDQLYLADFIQLGAFFFQKYTLKPFGPDVIEKLIISSNGRETDEKLADRVRSFIESYEAKSNWDRYFACRLEVEDLDEKWRTLYRFRNPAEAALTHFQGNFEMYEAAVDPMHVLEEAAQSVDEPYRELAEAMRETEEPFLKLQGSMQQDESV